MHNVSDSKIAEDETMFSDWERGIFGKVKKVRHWRGGVVLYAAQANVKTDAEIAKKGRSRLKTT